MGLLPNLDIKWIHDFGERWSGNLSFISSSTFNLIVIWEEQFLYICLTVVHLTHGEELTTHAIDRKNTKMIPSHGLSHWALIIYKSLIIRLECIAALLRCMSRVIALNIYVVRITGDLGWQIKGLSTFWFITNKLAWATDTERNI